MRTFTKTVAAAGTPEALIADTTAKFADRAVRVHIQARDVNVGKIWVGVKGLVKATYVNVGHLLMNPGDSIDLDMPVGSNLLRPADIYIDVDIAGEGVVGYFVEA